jgi:hypothetical protein
VKSTQGIDGPPFRLFSISLGPVLKKAVNPIPNEVCHRPAFGRGPLPEGACLLLGKLDLSANHDVIITSLCYIMPSYLG